MRLGPITVVRGVAAAVVFRRLAGAARARSPLAPVSEPAASAISVVIPARDEADRLRPLLQGLVAAEGLHEIIVVDDESTDDTAALATTFGAQVVAGAPRPRGWTGKTWALQQGVAAATGDWIVSLDADTRPDPRLPASAVARAEADGCDLVTLAGRFDLPSPGARLLHAAMLTTLVYRFGPPGAMAPGRELANGQCMVFRRDVGDLAPVAHHIVEDVAFVRHAAADGRVVGFLDASDLLSVRPYESMGATWSGWSRSLGLPGVEVWPRRLVELGVLALTLPLPLGRLLVRRGDLLDVLLLASRLGTLVGTRRAYDRGGAAYWLSPLADLAAVVAVGRSSVRRWVTWRDRSYDVR